MCIFIGVPTNLLLAEIYKLCHVEMGANAIKQACPPWLNGSAAVFH